MDHPNKTCGVEPYCPHFAARQFGLVQGILCPVLYFGNPRLITRKVFKQKEEVEMVEKVNQESNNL